MFADVAFLWLASIPLGALFGLVPFVIYIALKIDWAIKTLIGVWRLKSRRWIRIV